jgi:hypothetical protein
VDISGFKEEEALNIFEEEEASGVHLMKLDTPTLGSYKLTIVISS